MMLVGDVKGRTAVLVDDLADTSNTITRAARLLKKEGAAKIYALITHGILSGDAIERINDSPIDRVVTTNTVPQGDHVMKCPKLEVLEVGHVFAEAIRRVHHGESISVLFHATSTAKSGPLVPDRVATSNAAAQDPIVKAEPLEPSASPMTTPEFRATDVSAISVASSAATHTAEVKGERTVEVTSGPLRRKHRGAGTVNMLRRGVVMDILAQCQGMCPLGAELWLPFATAWQKQHAVKPDKRTLQATVKQLVDAGKVRQLTFSGRNSRNMMVTRSIIATPDISTQDPRLIDLQQKVLAADPQPYIPANLEIAPDIRKDKQAGNVQPSLRDEPEEVSVLMHRAPLRVLKLQETRRLRTEQGQARLDALLHQRLKRLATTHSRAGTGVAIPLQTIETLERRRKLERWLPRLNALGIDIPGRSTAQRDALLHPPTLPRNLQDVLDIVGPADTTEMKALRSDFFAQIDAVERWELEVLELYASHVSRAPNQWAFINHFAGEAVPTVPMERSPQWAVSAVAPEVPPTRYRRLAVLPAPPTADLVSTVLPKKRRKRTQREQAPRRLASYTRQAAPQKTENRTIAGRRNKGLKAFSHSLKRRLIAALVVLRTLVGGNEGKALDWSYIQLAFPDHDPRSIIPPGKTLLARHRLQIPKLQAEFQERFLIAYEAGEVPPIDYEHLEQYDWAGLVDWVCEELEFSSENALPSLPATRERFDSIFNVQVEPLQQLSEMFQQNAPPTTYRRQQLYASVAFATPLSSVEPSGDDSISQRLQAARTWVRASVITSDENFDAKAAEAMLAHIEPALLSQAKEALAKEGAIHHKNKGRFVPGRSYDLTENFIHTLGKRRHIESTQLTQAATFKQNVLDPELRTRGRYTVKYDAEDGDVLAVINMMQAGRVTIHPVNPPRDKYGLTDGGYLTRLMDKGKLRFDVEVKPVESRYIYGNPLEDKKHSIPRGEMPDDFPASATEHEPCRIPLWFDVHGNFVRLLWDSAAAAVAGLLAARPGMTSVDVAQMLRPCLEVWEVALVVEFMLGLGIVEDRAGDHQQPATAEAAMHWYLKEWWWMMLAAEPQP
ncbi:hypothetical protein KEM52_000832 [Ascosphaera acerosa]|nr:hypothetical protein KEM52_000832 [Ascosphaera acerosa]